MDEDGRVCVLVLRERYLCLGGGGRCGLVRMGVTFADAVVFGGGCTHKFIGGLLGSSSMGDDGL